MNIQEEINRFKQQGFTDEQALVISLMRLAAGVLFSAFPDSFLLFGGATLLFFHNSVRHSGDIDLLSRTDEPPTAEALQEALAGGLASTAEALKIGPLKFEQVSKTDPDTKLWVKGADGKSLFRIDLSRYGSILEGEIVVHEVTIDEDNIAKIKSASREFLLLQKAECFLLRRIIKTRDAIDIWQLKKLGASLDENLKAHLADTLMSHEIEPEQIRKRIEQVDEKRCTQELRSILPPDVFDSLAAQVFKPLRDALFEIYQEWLDE